MQSRSDSSSCSINSEDRSRQTTKSTVHHENVEVLIDGTLRDIENEFGWKVVRIDRNTLIAMDHLEGPVPSRLHFMTDLPNVAAVFRAERCPDENTPNCDMNRQIANYVRGK